MGGSVPTKIQYGCYGGADISVSLENPLPPALAHCFQDALEHLLLESRSSRAEISSRAGIESDFTDVSLSEGGNSPKGAISL